MIKTITRFFLLFLVASVCNFRVCAQNSVLINFGDTSCAGIAPPSFSFIRDPLSASPALLTNCVLQQQLPDIYYVFVAYNPLNGKIYIADTRTGTTKIWILDMSLPADITCPSSIPVSPDYTYSYVSNNFEFDNNGDLWSLSNFDPVSGQAHIDKFDVTTGTILSTSILQFPAGQSPSAIYTGDITILPNGRMFAVLGIPSQLYEITGYTTGNATATYLQTTPKSCFGLAYLNGGLELTGFDGLGCYRYSYSISSNSLSDEAPFQNGQTPVDNSSISPTIGAAKRLLAVQLLDGNSANLRYEIYVENIGNVKLNNISLQDDLGTAFGAGNVSNVAAVIVPGTNVPGLAINPAYDGVNDINLLSSGAQLDNKTNTTTNYNFSVIINCTVSHLNTSTIYFNSAIAGGSIGNALNNTLVAVSDSSNDGNAASTDPNNDGNASEPGENVPTPFNYGLLPVRFLDVSAVLTDKTSSLVTWRVATPMQDAAYFEPEYSSDGVHWTLLSHIPITDLNLGNYNCVQKNIPGGIVFYRVKQADNDGRLLYSKIVSLRTGDGSGYAIFPNPADDFITIISPQNAPHPAGAALYDAIGRLVLSSTITSSYQQLSCAKLPTGAYFIVIKNDNAVFTQKIVIRR